MEINSVDYPSKRYFQYGLFIRPFGKVEVLLAAFKFEHNALDYCKTFPEKSYAIVRWIGEGAAPLEAGVTDNPRYL